MSAANEDVVLDAEEIMHFRSVLRALSSYRSSVGEPFIARRAREFQLLEKNSPRSAEIFKDDFVRYLEASQECIYANEAFLNLVVEADPMYDNVANREEFGASGSSSQAAIQGPALGDSTSISPQDVDKVRSTLRQLVRDWSVEGENERAQCYAPLLDAIEQHFLQEAAVSTRSAFHVLCPGSGLGRLPFEFVRRGFSAQGNEFSYFMLLVSNFLLNHSHTTDQWTVHPHVTQASNVWKWEDSLRDVRIPDIVPSLELEEVFARHASAQPEFGMCAGEFIDVYRPQIEAFDAVATPFFIDTAHDVVEYIEVIHSTLRSGGVWANIGPLLWHYEDVPSERSVELPWEAVRKAIIAVGFEITTEKRVPCTYASNALSMMRTVYDCIFFVALKR